MNIKQKKLLQNIFYVISITAFSIFALVNVKDKIGKSEAMRAMNILSAHIQKYYKTTKSLPAENYVDGIVESQGMVRLGNLQYRARWISYGAGSDTILAYAQRDYKWLVRPGYVVMRLDGRVEWLSRSHFKEIIKNQQTEAELELLKERLSK